MILVVPSNKEQCLHTSPCPAANEAEIKGDCEASLSRCSWVRGTQNRENGIRGTNPNAGGGIGTSFARFGGMVSKGRANGWLVCSLIFKTRAAQAIMKAFICCRAQSKSCSGQFLYPFKLKRKKGSSAVKQRVSMVYFTGRLFRFYLLHGFICPV